jgi:hypothetical protein
MLRFPKLVGRTTSRKCSNLTFGWLKSSRHHIQTINRSLISRNLLQPYRVRRRMQSRCHLWPSNSASSSDRLPQGIEPVGKLFQRVFSCKLKTRSGLRSGKRHDKKATALGPLWGMIRLCLLNHATTVRVLRCWIVFIELLARFLSSSLRRSHSKRKGKGILTVKL